MSQAPAGLPALLRLPAVEREVGFKKSQLYHLIQRQIFPPPIKVGRMSLWPRDQVLDFVERVKRGEITQASGPQAGSAPR